MKKTFLTYEKPLLTCMVQGNTPDRVRELMRKSLTDGAEAFGMQFCRMKPEYRNRRVYGELFGYTDKPVYVTNYRCLENEGKSDERLASELLELAECGATLCDVMGDYFAPCEGELTMNEQAVKKQMELIAELHARGAEVLMSSHVQKFMPAESVLELALEHQRRGADICKIVTRADSMEEQIENLRIIDMLKNKLEIPFLFLAGGECRIIRRIGGEIGCCMYLCVFEHDEFATPVQPLLSEVKQIRELMEVRI